MSRADLRQGGAGLRGGARRAFPALVWLLGACNVGPNYARPPVTTPEAFRGKASDASAATKPSASGASIADEHWWVLFEDESLRELIKTSLSNNYDVAVAANRVLQAEAQHGIVRADQYPNINGQASVTAQRGRLGGGAPDTGVAFQLGASLSWEIDFWGKFRRASEAARAEILGNEWARRAVLTSLVSQVATSYFSLRALDQQLEIAKRTLVSRQESLRLTEVRDRGGAGSLVDVYQAQQLVQGASASIVELTRDIEQEENALSVLLGQNPGAVARGRALRDQVHPPELPPGLPSALLERRPDIQVAEQQLVAANAEIGVAEAAYFPQIGLTASGGVLSPALSTLFSGPAVVWSAAASLVQPIFDAGRTRSRVSLAELRRDEAVLNYRQTIQQAFREVADALVGYASSRELRGIRQELVRSAEAARRLADMRYQGGASSYLEVLDSETRLFSAELESVQADLSELTAYVEIYRALGGGWRS
jgi:outer membrane protein, multidrug efflux system